MVLAVGGFIGRVGALVAGRRARQAYQKMDPQQKKAYRQLLLQRFGMLGALFAAYYAAHLNRAPVTGRWRVLFLSHEDEIALGEESAAEILSGCVPQEELTPQEIKVMRRRKKKVAAAAAAPGGGGDDDGSTKPQKRKLMKKRKNGGRGDGNGADGNDSLNADDYEEFTMVFSKSDPAYKRVKRVCDRLVNALGKLGPEVVDPAILARLTFKLHVLKAPTPEVNAFVLPDGSIFVYKGLLDQECHGVDGDDKLAVVIGHEIAHALQRHIGEKLSESYTMNAAMMGLAFAMSALGLDFVSGWMADLFLLSVQHELVSLLLEMPHSRACEAEADHVGILVTSAACHDPKAGARLWTEWDENMRKAAARATRRQHQPLSDEEVEAAKRAANRTEFLHTHPTNDHRSASLKTLLPAAEELRDEVCTAAELDFQKALKKAAADRMRARAAAAARAQERARWRAVPTMWNGYGRLRQASFAELLGLGPREPVEPKEEEEAAAAAAAAAAAVAAAAAAAAALVK